MTPTWVDEVMPFRGPCAFCAGPDARHRTLDAIKERVAAGDSAESVAEDYGCSLSFVERVVAEWDEQSNEAEEPPVSTTERIINEIAAECERFAGYTSQEIADAGAAYARGSSGEFTPGEQRAALVRAATLCVMKIERLDRAEGRQ